MEYRNTNIGLAAARINGNTASPGQIFSLDMASTSKSRGSITVKVWEYASTDRIICAKNKG